GGTIILPNMKPAENRWIALKLTAAKASGPVPVNFYEIFNGRAVNGFTILTRPVGFDSAVSENLKEHAHAFSRLVAAFRLEPAVDEARAAEELRSKGRVSRENYLTFLDGHQEKIKGLIDQLFSNQQSADSFELRATLAELHKRV